MPGPISQPQTLADVKTLPELLRWRVEATPAAEAYRHFDAHAGRWVSQSWHEIDAEFELWRRALAAENFSPGERVAILMPNGIAHIAMDQASLSRGLVPVPMHAVDNPDSIAYILADSGALLLFVDTLARWQAIVTTGQPLDALKRIVCADMTGPVPADARIVALDQWLASAPGATAPLSDVAVAPDDLAAIVYTSGTTGRPKGVMLSHDNVVANVKAIAHRIAASPDDVFLSFLPLSHTFERTGGYYYPIAAGACVAYARSVPQLGDDLKHVRPTVLVSVPRIYERVYALIMQHRASAGSIERALLDLTIAVGGRRFDARQGRGALSLLDRLAWPLLKQLVADKVLAQLGGRLRVAVSGGAPIAEPVIRLFLALGLDILQGYGMTETSPVISVNTPEDNDPRSVGHVLDGVEARLGENDELLVRGPSVMLGYWHKPEETRRVKEADGWLHTGDQARIENGRITITGRIKDILVTSTGEKIAPVDLETAILADPLFEQALMVGEQRPFLAALVVLNAKAWVQEKERLAASGKRGGAAERAALLARIAAAVKAYPSYATPRAVWWTLDPWTIASGLLTPTLKNKRPALEHRFAEEIAQIYAKKPAATVKAQ
ncbi:long-chain acyl-CoA synthetase [Bradyrhizobium diazoefficiens]|uniref:Long-chain-fatty-acid-CoA ligase n=1 Tax=Bradyrhizobium diazoefficiens TaxID=1355477 RepID=A0A0E3VTU5_9BRAD|nr:AMP-dependent synthetase/ligase [Bradyrhizobium diazoefficiens]MBR0861824.1 long-chain fatty acid--CoA ligase [Bradyrhizobium diazoefficiens]MBR0886389.1 long-chain fatty acid--CoA ligase [Bradyrhizobium diazoefficiens]MBR0918051.1 long-chain fatty acid--CoA ligase [Bradyrhizobium diazoefficiens]BAR56270.1 long-chain-fatty-acid-CoA ligase [Bradyrhizobium diazoefficiens]